MSLRWCEGGFGGGRFLAVPNCATLLRQRAERPLELSRALTGPQTSEDVVLEALCHFAGGELEHWASVLSSLADLRDLPHNSSLLRTALHLLLEVRVAHFPRADLQSP